MTGHPDDPQLHLSIKALGDCTRHIQELTAGAEALIQGPFGGLFPAGSGRRPQVWIGGGIGITPFLSRASTLAPEEPSVDIIYAAANQSTAHYLSDLRELARGRVHMRVHTIFEDSDGLPTAEAIESRVGALEGKEFMLAGPPAMVRALRHELRARGVPAHRIHTEEGVLR
jgi:predicted ferric reductase